MPQSTKSTDHLAPYKAEIIQRNEKREDFLRGLRERSVHDPIAAAELIFEEQREADELRKRQENLTMLERERVAAENRRIQRIALGKEEAEKQRLKAIENERNRSKFVEAAKDRIKTIIAKHIETLNLKWDQTVSQDEYGNKLLGKWNQAKNYFFRNVLLKDDLIPRYLHGWEIEAYAATELTNVETLRIEREAEIQAAISEAIQEYKNKINVTQNQSIVIDDLDPIQFERYCADTLKNSGWEARVTQASNDQGIDVIAKYGNVKAVFQCKKYSQPVGNSAVQEIIAGKAFEQAHVAAVVSNATFTPSAKQLAAVTSVYLLHYSELPQFAARLGLVEESQT